MQQEEEDHYISGLLDLSGMSLSELRSAAVALHAAERRVIEQTCNPTKSVTSCSSRDTPDKEV